MPEPSPRTEDLVSDMPRPRTIRRTTRPLDDEGLAPEGAELDASRRVLRQFRIVFNAVKTHFQQMERQAGISGAQVWALHVVHQRPGVGVSELARAMDVRQPTASQFVKALVRHRLVEVRRDGADRRAVQLHVTPEGRDVLHKTPGPFTGVLPQALAALDPQTLARLELDLGKLIYQLGANECAATTPLGSG